ncbi:MAG TPA: hypothetical protein VFH59_03255 [Frateuria sp.]|uniref:hypothetical protein n=1 Tax=Frateuria sp. TaxID=2211372 RepID=UPI002D806456|nr:hypothetical protein [Frateuria sp.]HET6804444.1 hypothetical protein [Frateuria sp.]
MNVTLPIPDDLAPRLGAPGDVSRRALEAFGLAEYQAGRLTGPDLRRLLGFATEVQLDQFLTAHGQAPGDTPVARILAFRVGKRLGGLDPAALIREGRR